MRIHLYFNDNIKSMPRRVVEYGRDIKRKEQEETEQQIGKKCQTL
jgi:hypothetical protein